MPDDDYRLKGSVARFDWSAWAAGGKVPRRPEYRLEGSVGCFNWGVYGVGEDAEEPWRAEYSGCGQIDPDVLYEGDDLILAVHSVAGRLLTELDHWHRVAHLFRESPAACRALADDLDAGRLGKLATSLGHRDGDHFRSWAEYVEVHRQREQAQA